jgi:hypothetical protein
MKRAIILAGIILLLQTALTAQTASDALRYSRVYFGGSARFLGAGGAFGAVGADFSTLATNPAGIGLYKSTEFTFSPSLLFSGVKSTYENTTLTGTDANFGVQNAGFVYPVWKPVNQTGRGLRGFNVGFGVNRQNDFNGLANISGITNRSSLLDLSLIHI